VNVKAPSAILQGIEEYYRALPASIYPNPSSGTFNLICNDHRSSSYFITIQDVVGMKVKALSAESIDGELTEKIDLGTCPAGLYFLTITSGTGSATLKIILEK
jgi:hypothetical protein